MSGFILLCRARLHEVFDYTRSYSTYFYCTRYFLLCTFLPLFFDIFYTYIFMFTVDFWLLFFYRIHFTPLFLYVLKILFFRQKVNVFFFYITLFIYFPRLNLFHLLYPILFAFIRLWNLFFAFIILSNHIRFYSFLISCIFM